LKRAGEATLPLHDGHAPSWLVKRMKLLSKEIVKLIVLEDGTVGFIRKISDPLWFQAFGCLLGYDWHSSGLTTVVTGVLREALSIDEHGLAVVGGKGRLSRNIVEQIDELSSKLNFSTSRIEGLKYASKMCAKVDNTAVQDGYQLYHHAMIIDEKGKWCVVQQGMDIGSRSARRYHWLSENLRSFVDEPHKAVISEIKKDKVLNMTAREAEENRKACVDLVKSSPANVVSTINKALAGIQSMDYWLYPSKLKYDKSLVSFSMPWRTNWQVLRQLYDIQPRNYEELLYVRGVGPSTVRALALAAELIYGAKVSWRDPVKFSFAHGGKDGIPFPVKRRVMDETIRKLKEVVEAVEVEREEKVKSLKRLSMLAKKWGL
jgi:hypothetical protein